MTGQQRLPMGCQRIFPPTRDVVELMLLLPLNQFSALEGIAHRLKLTVGHLLRRTVSDFLLQPNPGTNRDASGVGEST